MEDECPMVEEKNLYVDNIQPLEYYLKEKPTLCDTITYYWTALIDNQHHKMNYIQLKSRMHRTEMFVDYYTRKGFKIEDAENKYLNEEVDIQTAYYIIRRIEWLLTDYGYMLWRSRAPYEVFLSKYIFYRDDILNNGQLETDTNENLSVKTDNIKTYNNGPPKVWDIQNYKKIVPRTKSRLIKHSVYLALDLMTMLEFMKNDIDRNDDLLFKILILTMNSLIFIGQFLWERYV